MFRSKYAPDVAVPNVPENAHEVAAVDVAVRVDELRRVRDVRGFDAELEPTSATHGERAEQRHVEVDRARPAELVAAGVAEPHALRLRPRCRVVVGAGRAHFPFFDTSPTRSAVCWLPGMFTIVAVRR